MNVHYSSKKVEWETPQELFDLLNEKFGFQTDVCALPENAKCKHYFTPETDGLKQDWTGVCWMNPPYGSDSPLFPLKELEVAHFLVKILSKSKNLWEHPLPSDGSGLHVLNEIERQKRLVFLDHKERKKIANDRLNILAVSTPRPSDALIELSAWMSINLADCKIGLQKFNSGLMNHFNFNVNSVTGRSFCRTALCPWSSLVDAYAALSVDNTCCPREKLIVHVAIIQYIIGFIKWSSTAIAGIDKWMEKAFESARSGATVVCLVPARTDTRWWHKYVMRGEYELLRGRVKFGGVKDNAPFPSAIVVFRPYDIRFHC